eukprot:SAG22_NODE_7742_length_712_cov_1.048940_1_plen_170_part_01
MVHAAVRPAIRRLAITPVRPPAQSGALPLTPPFPRRRPLSPPRRIELWFDEHVKTDEAKQALRDDLLAEIKASLQEVESRRRKSSKESTPHVTRSPPDLNCLLKLHAAYSTPELGAARAAEVPTEADLTAAPQVEPAPEPEPAAELEPAAEAAVEPAAVEPAAEAEAGSS